MSTLKVNNVQDLGADAVVTNGVIASGALPAGSILQVVSTTKTDAFSSSSSTFTDVTGLSASITPSSATSKVLVIVGVALASNGNSFGTHLQLLRDSTEIGGGTAAGSRISTSSMIFYVGNDASNQDGYASGAMNFLDSPATTSATTYKIQLRSTNNGTTAYLNRTASDSDGAFTPRPASTITLMEVAG